ncbi:MAG TPA: hypothetical protein VER04_18525, partial [Polyangiaceae bacterium]|nr:hypothetical protein [Polyangiaceae bacterium]
MIGHTARAGPSYTLELPTQGSRDRSSHCRVLRTPASHRIDLALVEFVVELRVLLGLEVFG